MDMKQNCRAIAYSVMDGRMRFLLLKAPKGYWENPGGGIEAGESSIEATLRETREESGITSMCLYPKTRVQTGYVSESNGNPVYICLDAYAVKVQPRGRVVLPYELEHIDYRWADYGSALAFLTGYPEQRYVFKRVVHKIPGFGFPGP